jgi:hypothetical protein
MGARDLLAELHGNGVSVRAESGRLQVWPASVLTDEHRAGLRDRLPVLLALLDGDAASGNAEARRFIARRARLLGWGWPEPQAEAVAERLLQRDRDVEVRVACVECKHYRPGRCGNHKRAGLGSDEVGRDLAGLLQRCDGFVSWRDWR